MTSIILTLTYIMSFSSNTILSMLLFLVATYITAALWLINSGAVYVGLLYILVYVGAIVVLIMFVVQLTNTSLNSNVYTSNNKLILLQNIVLILCISVLIVTAFSNSILLNITNFTLSDLNEATSGTLINSSIVEPSTTLLQLASTIFNEYGYILIVSVHAIILAVIGPVKLALK